MRARRSFPGLSTVSAETSDARTGEHHKAYGWFLKNLLLPFGDQIFGQALMRHLRHLEVAQWWNHDDLKRRRNLAVAQVVQTAYREVPFYRDLYDQHKVNPGDVSSMADLVKLPIVTKDMLRAGYPARTIRPTRQRTYEVSSSGSTGRNFYVREDAETSGRLRACFMLALGWAGWSIGERHLQTGMNLNRSLDRRLKDYLLRCYYVSAFDLSDERLDVTLNLIDRHSIKHVWGYPGSLYQLALRARSVGWNQPLQSVVTWGDTLFSHYRSTIEEAFGARVFDTYGCGEGIQVAAQCGHGDHYHVHMLDTALEFVDDDGLLAADDVPANIILTRLHAGPMPLIRYQVGDLGVRGDARACECGRGFELMAAVMGRDTDILMTPSGNRLLVHFFTGILEYFKEIDTFQVTQETVESLTLRIVPSHLFRKERIPAIVEALQARGARDMDIRVELVESIPASPSGKRRFIVSELSHPR